MAESDELVREIVRTGTDFLEWLDRVFPEDETRIRRAEFDRMPEADEGAGKLEAFEEAVRAWRQYVRGVQAQHSLELLFMGPHRN